MRNKKLLLCVCTLNTFNENKHSFVDYDYHQLCVISRKKAEENVFSIKAIYKRKNQR